MQNVSNNDREPKYARLAIGLNDSLSKGIRDWSFPYVPLSNASCRTGFVIDSSQRLWFFRKTTSPAVPLDLYEDRLLFTNFLHPWWIVQQYLLVFHIGRGCVISTKRWHYKWLYPSHKPYLGLPILRPPHIFRYLFQVPFRCFWIGRSCSKVCVSFTLLFLLRHHAWLEDSLEDRFPFCHPSLHLHRAIVDDLKS